MSEVTRKNEEVIEELRDKRRADEDVRRKLHNQIQDQKATLRRHLKAMIDHSIALTFALALGNVGRNSRVLSRTTQGKGATKRKRAKRGRCDSSIIRVVAKRSAACISLRCANITKWNLF